MLARRDLPGRNVLTTFVVITMFISGGMIPGYLNLRDLGLLNSLWVLMLPSMVNTWNMLLMRNFFMGIPLESERSRPHRRRQRAEAAGFHHPAAVPAHYRHAGAVLRRGVLEFLFQRNHL